MQRAQSDATSTVFIEDNERHRRIAGKNVLLGIRDSARSCGKWRFASSRGLERVKSARLQPGNAAVLALGRSVYCCRADKYVIQA